MQAQCTDMKQQAKARIGSGAAGFAIAAFAYNKLA